MEARVKQTRTKRTEAFLFFPFLLARSSISQRRLRLVGVINAADC